jgi:Ca2+-binding EF-hand superfamily protein
MPAAALLLRILAAVAEPAATDPVIVTGHAWAPFISPMGEPFRAHSATDDTLANWFRQADTNHDAALTAMEMQGDAERFFATLDRNRDGEVDPDELVHYEWEIAPDIQLMSKTRPAPGAAKPQKPKRDGEEGRWRPGRGTDEGLQGAARYGLLNMPEPVAAADADFNRGISAAEFRQAAADRFALLDTEHSGVLTLPQLEQVRAAILESGRSKRPSKTDTRVGSTLPRSD